MNAQDVINKIIRQIQQAQPTREEMLEDIKLMKFKIKPLSGDINNINGVDNSFIESLWRIGRIDLILKTHFNKLSDEEKASVVQFLKHLEEKTEDGVRHDIDALSPQQKKQAQILKLAIFRDELKEQLLIN